MIVTCPDCSTRYLVDPQSLGTAGRVVRCAQCGRTWHQGPPSDAPRRVDLAPERDARLTAHDRIGLPGVAERPRRSWGGLAFWVVFLLLVVSAAVVGVLARDQIMTLWPQTTRLYGMLRLPVRDTGPGLQLRNVQPSRATENGLPTLVIEGEVVNVSNTRREVPKLKVILRDANNQELQSWDFNATDEPLAPGASIPFRTSVAQPNDAATGVMVTFSGGG